jgi:TonB family protein
LHSLFSEVIAIANDVTEVSFAADWISLILGRYLPAHMKAIALSLFVLLALSAFAPNRSLAQESTASARKVVTQVMPQYPSLARTMRIQGLVRLDVLVEPSGKVKSFEVKGGHPVLVQSAEDALRQWKWEAESHESHEMVELKFHP